MKKIKLLQRVVFSTFLVTNLFALNQNFSIDASKTSDNPSNLSEQVESSGNLQGPSDPASNQNTDPAPNQNSDQESNQKPDLDMSSDFEDWFAHIDFQRDDDIPCRDSIFSHLYSPREDSELPLLTNEEAMELAEKEFGDSSNFDPLQNFFQTPNMQGYENYFVVESEEKNSNRYLTPESKANFEMIAIEGKEMLEKAEIEAPKEHEERPSGFLDQVDLQDFTPQHQRLMQNSAQSQVVSGNLGTQSQVVSENLGVQPQIASQNVRTQSQVVSQNLGTQAQVASQNMRTQSQVASQNMRTQPQVVSQNAITQPQVASQNNMTQSQAASQNTITQPQVASQNTMTQPQVVSQNAMTQPQVASQNIAVQSQVVNNMSNLSNANRSRVAARQNVRALNVMAEAYKNVEQKKADSRAPMKASLGNANFRNQILGQNNASLNQENSNFLDRLHVEISDYPSQSKIIDNQTYDDWMKMCVDPDKISKDPAFNNGQFTEEQRQQILAEKKAKYDSYLNSVVSVFFDMKRTILEGEVTLGSLTSDIKWFKSVITDVEKYKKFKSTVDGILNCGYFYEFVNKNLSIIDRSIDLYTDQMINQLDLFLYKHKMLTYDIRGRIAKFMHYGIDCAVRIEKDFFVEKGIFFTELNKIFNTIKGSVVEAISKNPDLLNIDDSYLKNYLIESFNDYIKEIYNFNYINKLWLKFHIKRLSILKKDQCLANDYLFMLQELATNLSYEQINQIMNWFYATFENVKQGNYDLVTKNFVSEYSTHIKNSGFNREYTYLKNFCDITGLDRRLNIFYNAKSLPLFSIFGSRWYQKILFIYTKSSCAIKLSNTIEDRLFRKFVDFLTDITGRIDHREENREQNPYIERYINGMILSFNNFISCANVNTKDQNLSTIYTNLCYNNLSSFFANMLKCNDYFKIPTLNDSSSKKQLYAKSFIDLFLKKKIYKTWLFERAFKNCFNLNQIDRNGLALSYYQYNAADMKSIFNDKEHSLFFQSNNVDQVNIEYLHNSKQNFKIFYKNNVLYDVNGIAYNYRPITYNSAIDKVLINAAEIIKQVLTSTSNEYNAVTYNYVYNNFDQIKIDSTDYLINGICLVDFLKLAPLQNFPYMIVMSLFDGNNTRYCVFPIMYEIERVRDFNILKKRLLDGNYLLTGRNINIDSDFFELFLVNHEYRSMLVTLANNAIKIISMLDKEFWPLDSRYSIRKN